MVRIGWRKRVVEIDWSDTPVRRLVGKDDVTKTETLIHAWSVGKVVEYLSELASELNSDVLKDVLPHLEDLRAHHSHSASSEEEATSWEAVARLIQTIKHDTVRVR
ncbi:MAG: hypothetical protein KDB07_00370 [Planctomycetes bacterium]|nr:hypothetical protein [Planctomycetota bacterium]